MADLVLNTSFFKLDLLPKNWSKHNKAGRDWYPCKGGNKKDGHHRADLLLLEEKVWGHASQWPKETKTTWRGEPPVKETGGKSKPWQTDAAERSFKKVLRPAVKRETVSWL